MQNIPHIACLRCLMRVLGCQSNTRTIAVINPTAGKLINSRILCDDISAVECDDVVAVFTVLAEIDG